MSGQSTRTGSNACRDTATDAQRYISGTKNRDNHGWAKSPLHEPLREEAEALIDRFLSIYPSSYAQVAKFADARIQSYPERWQPIAISRQTVNTYFLRLGRYCWQHVAAPYLAREARRTVHLFDEINQEFGLINDDLTDLLVRNIASRYVKQANGTLFAERDVRLRYGRTIVYLTDRARKYQGLSLRHSREHMAWAFMQNSVQNKRGQDDRNYGARFLTGLLMRNPM